MNYNKTLYLDLSYAASEYKTSDTTVGNLKVDQWSPAIGFGFNEQYDWLQFRLFYVDLSSDLRTPGTDNTLAASAGWTHWFKQPRFLSAQKFNVTLLLGERLYGVDSDARKIYNLTDMQTGSAILGIHWGKNDDVNIYVYSGYEKFRDIASNDNYNSLFIFTGISTLW